MVKEIYKQIEGFPNYEVSNLGNIRNRITKHVRKPAIHRGYAQVGFKLNGKTHTKSVHRLVAIAFCEKPEGCNYVNHIDGVKTNNNAFNLEWCTCSENLRHAFENGLVAAKCKLGADGARAVKKMLADGEKQIDIARKFGVDKSTVNKIKTGDRWGWLK